MRYCQKGDFESPRHVWFGHFQPFHLVLIQSTREQEIGTLALCYRSLCLHLFITFFFLFYFLLSSCGMPLSCHYRGESDGFITVSEFWVVHNSDDIGV